MGRQVEVRVQSAHLNKALTAVVDPEEIKGKTMEQVLGLVLQKGWRGEDKDTATTILAERDSSGHYGVKAGKRDALTEPLHYQKVNLGEPVDKFIQDDGMPNDQLRLQITSRDVVGYSK